MIKVLFFGKFETMNGQEDVICYVAHAVGVKVWRRVGKDSTPIGSKNDLVFFKYCSANFLLVV